jgi:hypothetical protein
MDEARHITGLYALRRFRGSGYEKTQSGLRPLCAFSSPHFLCAGIASQFLYRAQKTSHTAGALSAISFGLVVNIDKYK